MLRGEGREIQLLCCPWRASLNRGLHTNVCSHAHKGSACLWLHVHSVTGLLSLKQCYLEVGGESNQALWCRAALPLRLCMLQHAPAVAAFPALQNRTTCPSADHLSVLQHPGIFSVSQALPELLQCLH